MANQDRDDSRSTSAGEDFKATNERLGDDYLQDQESNADDFLGRSDDDR